MDGRLLAGPALRQTLREASALFGERRLMVCEAKLQRSSAVIKFIVQENLRTQEDVVRHEEVVYNKIKPTCLSP